MCYICDQAGQVQDAVGKIWNPETERVNVAQLADAVRQAALDNPDKIYERLNGGGCKYTHEIGGEMVPGCIVGQGIFDLTGRLVDQDTLGMSVNSSSWKVALCATDGEADMFGDATPSRDPLTRYLVSWLRAVQGKQDDGKTWGDSVAYADRNIRFAEYMTS